MSTERIPIVRTILLYLKGQSTHKESSKDDWIINTEAMLETKGGRGGGGRGHDMHDIMDRCNEISFHNCAETIDKNQVTFIITIIIIFYQLRNYPL